MGAVGGYYGGRLAQGGMDVHFLLRSDYDYVKQHGLTVESYMGDFSLTGLNIYASAAQMPKCDVVLVATKTTANERLPELLLPMLKDDTLIVLAQNGIGVEADLQQRLPNAQLAAGIAFINCRKDGAGKLIHKGYGHITLCSYSCRDAERMEQVARDFAAAGVRAETGDYTECRWRKNILNMATNGMTVVCDCRCDELIADTVTRERVRTLMLEGIAAARACGATTLTDELADKMIATTGKTEFATSMKYDFDHHLPMEIEYMYTRPIQEAEKHGCSVPNLRILAEELRKLESKRATDRTN